MTLPAQAVVIASIKPEPLAEKFDIPLEVYLFSVVAGSPFPSTVRVTN